jgi:hypothetical protein
MAFDVDRFAAQRPREPSVLDPHHELPKQHFPDRHFVDDGVEPFDQQQFEVGRLTLDLNRCLRLDLRVRDDRGQGASSLFECLLRRRATPAYAHVGIMREMKNPAL